MGDKIGNEAQVPERTGKFSGNTLKIIAMATMFLDHTAVILLSQEKQPWLYLLFRFVGRFSFVIFASFIVVGFLHTRNVRNYILRMGVMALLTEIPFDLAFSHTYIEFGKQNVLFTFCIALIMLGAIRHFKDSIPAFIGFGFLACAAAVFLRCDYQYVGILMVLFYYFDQHDKTGRIFSLCTINIASGDLLQGIGGSLAVGLTENYDGTKATIPQWFCYLFYPVHLLVLWGIYLLL